MNQLKIGITGGTGYLGGRLIELLTESNASITCLVRESSNVSKLPSHIRLFYGELTDLESLTEFVKANDVIVHLAAQVSRTTRKNYYLSNVTGTENLCKAILVHNNKCRLINCSSIAAYRIKGFCKMQFTDYAKSKLAADRMVDSYKESIPVTTIVPGMIYGAGNNVFIPTIIENLENNNLFFVTGGEKYAPLSYIDDLCDLFIRAIFNEASVGNKYFGIKYSERGIHDFINLIALRTNNNPPANKFSKKILMTKAIIIQMLYTFFRIKKSPGLSIRMVDVVSINYKLSGNQLTNNLGWEAKVDMDEGIENVLSTHKSQNQQKTSKLITL